MKKRMLARIKVMKTKRMQRQVRHRSSPRPTDPKDLRGAKGALVKSAVEATLEDEPPVVQSAGQRHAPIRIGYD